MADNKDKNRNKKPAYKNKKPRSGKNPANGVRGGQPPKEDEEKSFSRDKYNDVSWYAKNTNMLRDAASFSYNEPLGTDMSWGEAFETTGQNTLQMSGAMGAVPGLISYQFVPCYGLSEDSASPLNLAAQNIYSYVRYMNSGAKNYDQADIMMYLMSMDNIYMMWNWAKRMYGYAMTYSQKNKYIPRVLAEADGINFDELFANLADFRLQLNSLAAQISSFCVPAVMPIFIRHSWMASNVYKDSDNEKAQLYMLSPMACYSFSETGSKYGSSLTNHINTCAAVLADLSSYKDVLNQIKSMIDAVAYSEDIGVMSGDILKAYGQDKLFKITPVEPDYVVLPVYNEEVLNQLHNMTLPHTIPMAAYNYTQDPQSGFIVWNPLFNQPDIYETRHLINMPWDNVEPGNTMIATRLTYSLKVSGDKMTFGAIGSEYISAAYIYSSNPTRWGTVGKRIYTPMNLPKSLTISYHDDPQHDMFQLWTISSLSNFDWHPKLYVLEDVGTLPDTVHDLQGVVCDISNYTWVDNHSLSNMHTTALLSEFNVPQIGSF